MEKTELQAKMDETPEHFYSFEKPYVFEGKTYDGVDLEALEKTTTKDLYELDKYFAGKGKRMLVPEVDREYCLAILAQANGLPLEFFNEMPARDSIRIRGRVQNFLVE